jgi:hypothetical protein
MDEDEASIENLYCTARDEGLPVLPLVMETAQIISNRNIWTLPVQSRFRCEFGCVGLEVWKSANLNGGIPPDRFAACLAAMTSRVVMVALPAGEGNGIRGSLQQYFTSVETISPPDSALQVLVCRMQPGTPPPVDAREDILAQCGHCSQVTPDE